MTIEFINLVQTNREAGYSDSTYNSTPPSLIISARETEAAADISFEVIGGDVNLFEQRGNTFILGSGPAFGLFPLGVDYDHPVGDNTYEIKVRITSTWLDGNYTTQTRTEVGTFQLVITDTAPPSLNLFSNPYLEDAFSIFEGTGQQQVRSALDATSSFGASFEAPASDGGGRLVYTLIDNDNGNFEFYDVKPGVKWLRTTENASLQVGNNGKAVHYVTVQVTDDTTTKNATIPISVRSVAPTAPTDVDPAGNEDSVAGFVSENAAIGTAVGVTVQSSDPGAAALRYSISSGQGFAVDPETGVVTVSDPSQFNFEAAPTRTFTLGATDGLTTTYTTFTVAVGDVNEAPEIQFGEGLTFQATEGVASVPGFIPTRDVDRGDAVTLSLEGADSERFVLDETSQLVFRTAPDYEQLHDANGDNIYDVTIVATDKGGLTDRRAIKVEVANTNETPVIVTERLTVESGKTAIGRIVATDPDGDALTFDYVSGDYESQGRFILRSDGTVAFWTSKTYDANVPANNIFSLPVSVTDRETGGLTATKTITVEILPPGTGPTDTLPPTAPAVRLLNDTGRSASDHVTNDARLLINPSEPGGTLSYAINGQARATYDATVLPTGAYRVEVFHTDAAGNTSAPSEVSFALDRDAPVVQADSASGTAGTAPLTGNVLTNDTDRMALSVAAIRVGAGSEQTLPTTESVAVTGANGVLTLSADGAYSYRPTQAGSDVFTQTIVDAAGNTSQTTLAFTVQAAPTVPTDPVMPTPPTGGGGGGSTPPTTPTPPTVPSTGGAASPAAGQTQTVSGITSGTLVVDGAGKVELTGTNTYTGPTEVKAGTLVVNGSIVSPVSVESGATLGGSGSVGTVAIEAGGALAPGNSPGILSTRDLSLAAGAALKQEIGGTVSGQFDQLKVTGTVTLSGANLDVSAFGGFASTRSDRFVIIDNDGTDAVSGSFAGLNEGAVLSFGARSLRISYQGGDGNDVTLTDTTGLSFQREAFGAVVTSPDSQAGQVYGLYEALLNRAPDALGLSGFTTALENGASLTQVAQAILGSVEHGPAQTNAAYVESLYANLLNRPADAAGLQSWTGQLAAGASQASVVAQIATSAEAKAVLAPAFANGVFVFDGSEASVARLYYGLLDRAPDAGGLRGFSAFIETSGAGPAGEAARLGQVASTILTSAEYTSQHAGQSDAAFVFDLYQDALGRAPDAGGQAGYLSALAHGTSRAQVALDITQSHEAQMHWHGAIQDGTLLVA